MATPGWSTAMPIVTGSAVCAPVRANASTATTTAPTATHVFRMHALRDAILLEPEEPEEPEELAFDFPSAVCDAARALCASGRSGRARSDVHARRTAL